MDTVVMVMAGGKGSRLGPITVHRAKPAVPFGGRYRIIDFVLSNLVNSGYRRIYVLTQYMASSLIKHLNRNWHLGTPSDFVEVVPAQMRRGERWYEGTADSVFQNLNLVWDARAQHVAVFGGDHVYKFAVDQMEAFHREVGADLTIAAWPVPVEEASRFGVIEVDRNRRIVGFQEKPKNPTPLPDDPTRCLVSMGNYFFRATVLQDALEADGANPDSNRDFGKDVIPRLLKDGAALYAYDFGENRVPGEPEHGKPYWRDVGTIDSYFIANMELRSRLPALNLYNRQWRIRTAQRDYPPARFVRSDRGAPPMVDDTLVCEGSIVQSASLREVLLGYDCFVHGGADISESLLLSGCDVGPGAKLRRVVCDKNCRFEEGAVVGFDAEADKARFPFVTDSGLVVLPKGTTVPAEGPIELAHDIAWMLRADPATKDAMAAFEGQIRTSERERHSFRSAGPRYLQQRWPLK